MASTSWKLHLKWVKWSEAMPFRLTLGWILASTHNEASICFCRILETIWNLCGDAAPFGAFQEGKAIGKNSRCTCCHCQKYKCYLRLFAADQSAYHKCRFIWSLYGNHIEPRIHQPCYDMIRHLCPTSIILHSKQAATLRSTILWATCWVVAAIAASPATRGKLPPEWNLFPQTHL